MFQANHAIKGRLSFVALVLLAAVANVATAQPQPAEGTAKAAGAENASKPLLTLSGAVDHKSGQTNRVAFAPEGNRIAATCEHGAVKVWEIPSGKVVVTLQADAKTAWDMAFSPTGKSLATAGHDGVARIWDLESGRQTLGLAGHSGPVYCVAFSPNGKLLATGSDDTTARVCDVATGKAILTLAGHTKGVFGLAFSRDGSRIASAGFDGETKIWDVGSGKELLALAEGAPVSCVRFSPDGRQLASAIATDRGIQVSDSSTGKILLTFPGRDTVAFTPDGRQIISVVPSIGPPTFVGGRRTVGATIKFHDAQTGREVRSLTDAGDVSALCVSADGTMLAAIGLEYGVKVWEIAKPSERAAK